MKNYFILFVLAISVIACKNDSKKETESPAAVSDMSAQPAVQPAADLAEAGNVLKEAKTDVEEIKSLRAQIDALPDNVKKTNADNIENLRSTLEGMEEKEAAFIQELEQALSNTPAADGAGGADAGGSADNSAVIQEATRSLKGYSNDLIQLREQVKDLSKKQ